MTVEQALEVRTLFRGVVIGTKYVVAPTRRSHARTSTFVIGSSVKADAPVAPTFLRYLGDDANAAHTLIACDDKADDDALYTITLAPGMAGTIVDDGEQTRPVQAPLGSYGPGPRVTLARNARARMECGAITFLIAPTERAAALPAAPLPWRSTEGRYHAASIVGSALVLLLLMAIPGDPRALSFDILAPERGLVKYLIKPPVEPAMPPIPDGDQLSAGTAHQEAGRTQASDPAHNRNASSAIKGQGAAPNARRASAPAPIDPRDAGVLGIFRRSAAARSIFEAGSALGPEGSTILGNLVAGPIGAAYGPGVLGATVADQDCTHAPCGRTIGGGGHLKTMGIFGGGGGGGDPDPHYGHNAGPLGPHRAHAVPEVILTDGHVTGSLDREIVRRTIRRHINEVKFCYEQELVVHRDLGGRVTVHFTIAATGQVLAAVLQSSTLGSPRVESCMVQAVRRWEFPRPVGGGLVMVSYPFMLTPAGGGD